MTISLTSAVIIGAGSLPIRCGEIFLEKGHRATAIVSSDPEVIRWAKLNSLHHLEFGENLADELGRLGFEYLFSINNEFILRQELLDLPTKLAVNYHDALLPKYAGINAASWALMNGESLHGISWHVISDLVDAGDILKQKTVEISERDTSLTLNSKCFEAAISAFGELIDDVSQDKAVQEKQNLDDRSFYPRSKRPPNAGFISWNDSALSISSLVRALDFGHHPNPLGSAMLLIASDFFIVKDVKVLDSTSHIQPGTVVSIREHSISVSSLDRDLEILRINDKYGREIPIAEFIEKFNLKEGFVFEHPAPDTTKDISKLCARASKFEKRWIKHILKIEPTEIPRPSGEFNAPHFTEEEVLLPVSLENLIDDANADCTPAEFVIVAFGQFVAQLNNTARLGVGFSDFETQLKFNGDCKFFAPAPPLGLHFNEDLNFYENLNSALKELDVFRSYGTFTRDIFARYPELDNVRDTDNSRYLPVNFARVQDLEEEYEKIPGSEFTFVAAENSLKCFISFDTSKYSAQFVKRLIRNFKSYLDAVEANPEKSIKSLPLVCNEEQNKMLVDWNLNSALYPDSSCIHQLFEDQASKTPNSTAVISGHESLTYVELNERANRVAGRLISLGVEPEMPVAICVKRSVALLTAILGVLKAGGAYVPLDPAYPPDRTAYILKDSRAGLLVTEKEIGTDLSLDGVKAVFLEELHEKTSGKAVPNHKTEVESTNLAYVIYTSGSTGQPKGVAITHRSAVALLTWSHSVFTPADLKGVLASTSVCFDLSVFEMFAPLTTGGTVVIAENLLQLPVIPRKNDVTLVNTVPSLLSELIKSSSLPESVRVVNLAGEPLTDSLVKRIYDLGIVDRVYDLYGPSEDTTYSTFALRKPGDVTIGRPIANTNAYIVDKNLRLVPIGFPGELCLGGDGLARGYLHREELTKEKFIKDPFKSDSDSRIYRTGDLARFKENGNIEYLGRFDNQVKIRGVRIELGEIEASLLAFPAVKEAVAIPFDRTPNEKTLIGYVVFEESTARSVDDLSDFLKNRLPHYLVPSSFVELDMMPLTPNGKIDKKSLPDPIFSVIDSDRPIVGARNETESRLMKIWESTLQVHPIDVTDNFFKLGGDSLNAVHMFVEVEQEFGKNIPLATLFESDTIEKLAEILNKEGWAERESSLVPIQPHGSKPVFFCFHARGGNVLFYRALSKHLGEDQPFYGVQARRLGGRQVGHATVEEMAEYYLAEIKEVQPNGPYFLGGTSFGGLTAFEVAQQLHAGGEEIGLVALLDTGTPSYPKYLSTTNGLRFSLYKFLRKIQNHFDTLVGLCWKDRGAYIGQKLRGVKARYKKRIMNAFKKFVRHFYSISARELPASYIQLEDQIGKAGLIYKPKNYPNKVTLFRATKQPYGIEEDRSLGWESLVSGELEILDVPGHHGSIITEPFVRILAEKLGKRIKISIDDETSEN